MLTYALKRRASPDLGGFKIYLLKYLAMQDFIDSIIHRPVRLHPREQEYIERTVMSANFPWFYVANQTFDNTAPDLPADIASFVEYKNAPYLSHQLLTRAEHESISNSDRPPNHFSTYYEFFIEIFHRFMVDNGLQYSKIYRANLNLNWFNGYNHTEPHFDHTWPHNNFIMYLNTCKDGQTIIWPEDFSASYIIPCEQYHAVNFKMNWHAHRFPPVGERRVVFVVTYI